MTLAFVVRGFVRFVPIGDKRFELKEDAAFEHRTCSPPELAIAFVYSGWRWHFFPSLFPIGASAQPSLPSPPRLLIVFGDRLAPTSFLRKL